jgi:SDR family mycofactocin-dependent oxidoreductase
MGNLEGKVAFITGAARGQGRSHAVRLAREGVDIIAVDLCRQIASVPYPMSTPDDLAETVAQVEALGRRIVAREADVRDRTRLSDALAAGISALGSVDIVLANAGIGPLSIHHRDEEWQDVIDVNLTGTYNTIKVTVPAMIAQAKGGSMVLTSSTAGLTGYGGDAPGVVGYVASKHAVVGLMRTYANFLSPHEIRVNSVHPTGVNTPMGVNAAVQEFFDSDPSLATSLANALPVSMIEPLDVSNAIAWLVSDEARYVTGVALPVDAGFVNRR